MRSTRRGSRNTSIWANWTDLVVIADAAMIFEGKHIALKAKGLPFILDTKFPFPPNVVRE